MDNKDKTKYKNKFVLVTGGAGYIGSILVRILLKSGYKVRVIDKFLFNRETLDEVRGNPGLDIIEGDIRSDDDLKKAIKDDVAAVVHLAAIVGDPACSVDINRAVGTNYLATKKIVELCKKSGVKRLVFASSCSVYGSSPTGKLDETSELNPVSVYAETKIDSERFMLENKDKNFCPVILRLATIYGLSPRMRFDLVVNYLSQRAVLEKNINIFGGDQWRPLVHVSDVANAFRFMIEQPEDNVCGQTFNVGSDRENYRLKDLGAMFEKMVPDVKVTYIEEIKDKRTYNVVFDKIAALGFKTTKSAKDGIKEIMDAVKNNRFGDINQRRYYNYRPD
ncbi:epimerase [Candidatus Woesearchaeota archaeon CG10_big_fil_rev_8_21_14_0_10_44_13]|nr:MAG: epimerase [Candidatus Woesearchaeota archaeon CG10_big_fil_rev_8_21_14_0_10_44_13]